MGQLKLVAICLLMVLIGAVLGRLPSRKGSERPVAAAPKLTAPARPLSVLLPPVQKSWHVVGKKTLLDSAFTFGSAQYIRITPPANPSPETIRIRLEGTLEADHPVRVAFLDAENMNRLQKGLPPHALGDFPAGFFSMARPEAPFWIVLYRPRPQQEAPIPTSEIGLGIYLLNAIRNGAFSNAQGIITVYQEASLFCDGQTAESVKKQMADYEAKHPPAVTLPPIQ